MNRRGFFRLIGRTAAAGVAAKVAPGSSLRKFLPDAPRTRRE